MHLAYLSLLFVSAVLAYLFICTNNSIPDSLFWKTQVLSKMCKQIYLFFPSKRPWGTGVKFLRWVKIKGTEQPKIQFCSIFDYMGKIQSWIKVNTKRWKVKIHIKMMVYYIWRISVLHKVFMPINEVWREAVLLEKIVMFCVAQRLPSKENAKH